MIREVARGGLSALQDYVVYHVITCLIPAFLLAGGMVAFVPEETALHYLGVASHHIAALLSAALASFFVAACS